MKIKINQLLFWGTAICSIIFYTACIDTARVPYISNITTSNLDTVLVFQSGFEGFTHMSPRGISDDDILGYDTNLENSNWNNLKVNDISTVYINYSGGDTTKRYARIVEDPVNPGNHVLNYCLKDYWMTTDNQEKGRVQIEFYDIKNGGYKEFSQSIKLYISPDFNSLKNYPDSIGWLTLAEFWNNEWWGNKPNGFRISLNVHKDNGIGKNFFFSIAAQDSGFVNIWEKVNRDIAIPVDKWFTIDYYFKEGNKTTGRFYMAITADGAPKQIIFDIHNFTYATKDPAPDGLTGYNPMKLYTSKQILSYMKSIGKPINIYWDDFKLKTINR